MNYTLIKQLIDLAEQFEQEQPDSGTSSLLDFVAWLNQQTVEKKQNIPQAPKPTLNQFETVESAIGKLLIYMTRYAKGYSKKALAGTPLVSTDDFAYLGSLLVNESLTKMELIDKHIHEKTSGIEVIKRLLKNELAEQWDDEEDKRSKRLRITPKGREVLKTAFANMGTVALLISGNLTQEEKYQLLFILNKLNLFHNPIFLHHRDTSLEQLVKEQISPLHHQGNKKT